MNVKIQGSGNGTYANTGSCVAVTNYLQHEDLERMKKGEEVQPFFNQFRDYVSAREVTFKIDNNKAKLSRTDAKFYVITVSPSEKELRCMGRTPQECAEALRRYIRQDVMRNYAEGFGKGLKSDDVEYYAKIHFNRDGESDSDMHAHIIVSRKDRSNTRKLSPKTNHTGKKNCGNVKGGFDRTDFFRKCERCFDVRMNYNREIKGKYSINSLVYWVTYVHNVVYSFYRSMIYCYINSTQRCAGSIEIDIIPTNGADKRKFSPFAPYFPVTNVIKRYFYPYFPAIIGIKGYSFPYFPYLSGIMKIKTALYSLFSRLDWHKTVVFPCLGEIYEGIRSLSWEIPVT